MNILVVDYLGEKGHRKFNKIHFEALECLGHTLFYVGRDGQFPGLITKQNHIIIPEHFYKKRIWSSLTARLAMIRCILWVRKRINFNYDCIIVPTYDVFSVWAIYSNKPLIIINHNNVGQLNNYIKRFITKIVTSRAIHIVLNKDMERRLKTILPRGEIFYIPHGYCPIGTAQKPAFVKDNDQFIFCPINRNYDPSFTDSLFTSQEWVELLKDYGLKMYVKKGIVGESNDRVHVIESNLLPEEYEYLMQYSSCVVLPYNEQFRYRCSGIFFECIAADKPIVVSDIEAFKEYQSIDGTYFFSGLQALTNCIKESLVHKPKRNKVSFLPGPYWDLLFKNKFKNESSDC